MRLDCSSASMRLASQISVRYSGIHFSWHQQLSQIEPLCLNSTRNHNRQYTQLLYPEEGQV